MVKGGHDNVMKWGMSTVKGWRTTLDGWQEVNWTI
jgi:hypothetical protein